MNYPHLATRLFNTPLMARFDTAQAFAAAFDRLARGDASGLPGVQGRVTSSGIDKARQAAYDVTSDGIAVLTIEGPLVQRAGQISPDCTPIASYQWINAQLLEAGRDPKVRAILLEFDSPGGEVSNVFELGNRIRAMPEESGKPIWAIANEGMFSAAYALGAGAEKIMLPPTAMAGSIGVIMLHLDVSAAAKKKGYAFTPIFAGARKNDFSMFEPLSKEALAIGQQRVDELYAGFAGYVAQMRGIEVADIQKLESGVFSAAESVRLGLADGVATLDETLTQMREHLRSRTFGNGVRAAAISPPAKLENRQMSDSTTTPAAPEPAKVDAAKLQAEARVAERARVKAITGGEEAKGREELAAHLAHETEMSADAAIAILKASPVKPAAAEAPKQNDFAAAMARVPNPKVGAGGGDGDDKQKAVVNLMPYLDARYKQAS